MYSFLKAFLVLMKLLSPSQFYALNDLVFSQKLKLLRGSVLTESPQQHSQSYRSSFSMTARQSFVLLL